MKLAQVLALLIWLVGCGSTTGSGAIPPITRSAVVSWTASAQPAGVVVQNYTVWRSTNGGTFMRVQANITKTTWTDRSILENTLYCYKVTSVDTAGFSSVFSAQACTN